MTKDQNTESEFFKDRKEAHEWLEDNGYKVSQGKFYQDIKKKGFPVLNPDKTVSKFQVLLYGQKLQGGQASDPSALHSSEWAHRKEKADAISAEIKAKKMEREEDELWLHADQAWAAIAALVGSLRQAVRHQSHQISPEVVLAAGGEASRAPEIFELLEAATDKAFNEVAGSKLEISFREGK